MENTRKDTASAEMAGRDLSVMFQKNNALTQRALVMAPASWESASVSQDTKEKYAKKVRAPFQSIASGFAPTELSKAPFYASGREMILTTHKCPACLLCTWRRESESGE